MYANRLGFYPPAPSFPQPSGPISPFPANTFPMYSGLTIDLPGFNFAVPQEVGEWIEMGRTALDVWGKIQAGAGGCWRGYPKSGIPPCAGTPDFDAIHRAFSRISEGEARAFATLVRNVNDGRGPKSKADLLRKDCLPIWVKAAMGGGDCVSSKDPSIPGRLQAIVAEYGHPEQPGEFLPAGLPSLDMPGGKTAVAVAALLAAFFLVPAIFGRKGR